VIASVFPEKNCTTFLFTDFYIASLFWLLLSASPVPYYCFLDFISSVKRSRRQMRNSWASCWRFPSKKGQYLSKTLLKLRVLMTY